MSEEIAVTIPTDSATVPALPEISSLSAEQRQEWRKTGEMPKAQDSAPAKDSQPPADSAPQKKTADTASDSATEKQQPHLKTKDDTAKRFQEILDENKKLRERVEAIERQPRTETRKQESQPAPVEKKAPPSLRQFMEEFVKTNKDKTYEEGVEAWQLAREEWKDQETKKQIEQATLSERQRIAQESAVKELQSKMTEAKERYGDEEVGKIFPALDSLLGDAQIPPAIKAVLNDSDVLIDLMYVLSSDAAEYQKFLTLARTQPGSALRKLVTTEALVKEQLSGKKTPERSEDGKFVKKAEEPKAEKKEAAEPQSKAPRPPREVGGNNSEPEQSDVAAVKAGDFRAAKAAWTRDYAAAHR